MKKLKPAQLYALLSLLWLVGLTACTMGPNYVRPEVKLPDAYKELKDWKIATPKDDQPKGNWWEIFQDPELNRYVEALNQSNYSLKVAAANYELAKNQIDAAEAAYYPTVTAGTSAIRSKPASNVNNSLNYNPNYNTAYRVSASASWIPDFWGGVKRNVEANKASAEASLANLGAARLSTQSLLVQDYLTIRSLDNQKAILDQTIQNNQKLLSLTRVSFEHGTASRADLLTAETQVEQVKVQRKNLDIQRGQLEHAMATLMGKAPAEFNLESKPGYDFSHLPTPSLSMPSELLERRPDIAAAERAVAQANANIGIAEAAMFPNLTIAPTFGFQSVIFSKLFNTPSRFWSLGPSLSGTIFNGGLFQAQKREAVASYDQTVMQYRQTVLNAITQVEDNLLSINTLNEESVSQQSILEKSKEALAIYTTQFESGTANYLNVLTAQSASLSNQLSLLSIQTSQHLSLVSLVVALGGDWQHPQSRP
jgi:NodT family efflux transporter outer membrane factor (OMF) lipoprotein